MERFLGWKPRFAALMVEATAPIYLRTGARRLHPLGSGVFLALGDRRFLATAAHVADAVHKGSPVLGFGETIASVKPRFVTTALPAGVTRQADRIDVAVAEIDQLELVDKPVTAVPVRLLDVSEGDYGDDLFVASGYPCTKQDPRIIDDDLEAFLYRAAALASPVAVDAHVGRVVHLDLGFDRRRLFVEGQQKTGPQLNGMSGCGIWRADPATRDLRLAGILIEYDHGRRRIRGARTWVVLAAIAYAFPELGYLIPEVGSVLGLA